MKDNTFEDYAKEVSKAVEVQNQNMKVPEGNSRIFQYPEGVLLQKMKSLDSMSDQEAYELIKQEYLGLMEDIFKRKYNDYKFLLDSPKFLNLLIQVVKNGILQYDTKVYCNAFIYKYIVHTEDGSYIKELLFTLGDYVNRYYSKKLMGWEIDEKLAIFLAVAAHSAFDPVINIKRVNFTIATACPQNMDDKTIIHIYEALYDNVKDLIVTTLFDKEIINQSYSDNWVTQDMLNVDARIVYIVMLILESMIPIEITMVLLDIAKTFEVQYQCNSDSCRVNFHNLDKNEFRKVSVIVEQLEGDGYMFP